MVLHSVVDGSCLANALILAIVADGAPLGQISDI